ncbi:hypothetical protein [Actinacidiphila rubida]|nr:hypothetical protein [Actinacidiphila rubida]
MTTAPPPPREEDDEPSDLPDTVWEEFARDTAAKIRSDAPKEPSARARMVTERLRREDADAQERARAAKPRGRRQKRQEPEGWRTGPAWREMQRGERGPWRDRIRTPAIVAAVAVLALIAVNPSGARSLVLGHGHSSGSDETSSTGTPLPPETATPTAAPTVAAEPDAPTPSHPFAGSPALQWADGAAGIVLPHPAPAGDLTAKQVAAVLRTTKAFLVATNLDPEELRGGYPTAALRLTDPVNGVRAMMTADLRSPSAKADPTVWFTRYNPAHFRLVGSVVKVRGRMTFARADHGAVRVRTDYSYVYAFTQAGDPHGTVARLIVRRELDTQWYPHSDPGKVQIVAQGAEFGGSGCGFVDGYLHPYFGGTPGAAPTGPATDPYDRTKSLAKAGSCGTVSRT